MGSPSFREQVIEDFRSILGNPEEFGAIHLFNGREIQMVVAAAPAEKLIYYTSGELQEIKEIVVPVTDMPKLPKTTEVVNLDGVEHYVDESWVEFVFVHVRLVRFLS